MTTQCGQLGGSARVADTNTTDSLKAVVETVERLFGPSAIGDYLPSLLLFNKRLFLSSKLGPFPFLLVPCPLSFLLMPNVLIILLFSSPFLMAVVPCHFLSCSLLLIRPVLRLL